MRKLRRRHYLSVDFSSTTNLVLSAIESWATTAVSSAIVPQLSPTVLTTWRLSKNDSAVSLAL